MHIKSAFNYNTGGGCIVMFMTIEAGDQLKQISYDGDCFVGLRRQFEEIDDFMTPKDELWGVYDWQELINAVGIDLALEISKRVKAIWRYSDNVQNPEAIRSIEKLINFTTAASELYDSWHENLNMSYPFDDDKPFEDVLVDIFNWQQVVLNKHR